MSSVDEILAGHGLRHETARRCIAGMLQYNQAGTAEWAGVDVSTMKRYHDAFQEMPDAVFWRVVATIAHERMNELADKDVEAVSGF